MAIAAATRLIERCDLIAAYRVFQMALHPTTAAQPVLAHFDFIDALRGLAFLGVLVHHAVARIPHLNSSVVRVAEQGHEGVELFFLVSALTLFFSLDSRRRSERRPTLNFFIRRFFRIAPLFYIGAQLLLLASIEP